MRYQDIEPDVEILDSSLPWYQRKGCVTFVIIFIIILIFGGVFSWFVYQYYQGIKTGKLTPEMQAVLDKFVDQGNISKTDTVTKDDDPTYGKQDAKIIVIAFEDFQCPYSGQTYPVLKEVLPKYQDKILFVYRDFPTGHPFSQKAAEAANCAYEQGAFWNYHDVLFQNKDNILAEGDLINLASLVDINIEQFTNCFNSEKYKGEVNKDFTDGQLAGVVGTPTFFINGIKVEGVYPKEFWIQVFDYLSK